MAPLTKEERSAAAKTAAETRRQNKLAEENRAREQETNNNHSMNWLPWVLLGLLVLGLLIWHPWTVPATTEEAPIVPTEAAPTEPPITSTEAPIVAEATEAPVISTEAPVVATEQSSVAKIDVPGPVAASDPAPVCPNWDASKEVTQMLPPGMTAIGDVEVNNIIRYDIGGSGESTIVVNLSSKNVEIYAQWGSGCEWTTDIQSVVDKQRYAGCDDTNKDGIVDGCNRVRIILITDLGTEEKFVEPTVKQYHQIPKKPLGLHLSQFGFSH